MRRAKQLRCNACGEVFTAQAPDGVGSEKYDETASSMILEQRCFYRDADGLDRQAWHVLGTAPSGELVAYARLLPPAPSGDEPAIGRVAVAQPWRGKGAGRASIAAALELAAALFPGRAVRVSAQAHRSGSTRASGS